MDERRLRLVAGLGNPGDAYAGTRHNVGFMAIDALAEAFGIRLQRDRGAVDIGFGAIASTPVILLKPLSYMNRSGTAVGQIARQHAVSTQDIIVVHDDIDIAFGRLKIKEKGGHAGHKGIQSIIDILGGADFVRLRVGVGRGGGQEGVTDHVLGTFTPAETPVLDRIILTARDALVTILCKGIREAMTRFNVKNHPISS
jgi:PTH1 family peptidyl-tRNA hydrolase